MVRFANQDGTRFVHRELSTVEADLYINEALYYNLSKVAKDNVVDELAQQYLDIDVRVPIEKIEPVELTDIFENHIIELLQSAENDVKNLFHLQPRRLYSPSNSKLAKSILALVLNSTKESNIGKTLESYKGEALINLLSFLRTLRWEII